VLVVTHRLGNAPPPARTQPGHGTSC